MVKVICINNSSLSSIKELTLNKVYDAEIITGVVSSLGETKYYRIINDNGNIGDYFTDRFKLLSDWREKQMKSILND